MPDGPLRLEHVESPACHHRDRGRRPHAGRGLRRLRGVPVWLSELLIQDLHIRIMDSTTGELLRELVLDPTRDHQPARRPPGPAHTWQTPEPTIRRFGRPRCPETAQCAGKSLLTCSF